MTLSIYLNFGGNCREVFEFYRSVFGGEFEILQTFGDGPGDMDVPEDELDDIMHVSFRIGSSVLMGSDMPSGFGPPVQMGNNFSISYTTESKEQTDDLFAKISEGGTVSMPPADMFWGSYFGSCTDKFGVNWQFNYDPPQE
ncbi:MAG: VOC family protein [Chloroflexi bacterium]|nr:VOC family protein [Chloroflexota bacterium]MCY3937365.1 VOC family protein [Chloroflexota bacterium]